MSIEFPSNRYFRTRLDEDIAILTFDQADLSTNLLGLDTVRYYLDAAEYLLAQSDVRGLILTSAKKDFMAGADLKAFFPPPTDKAGFLNELLSIHQRMVALEQQGKPIVAALSGTTLGGGYELALSCHYRLTVSDETIRIGLPEVSLGLLPGGGGTQRLVRMLGLAPTIDIILNAKQLAPKAAFNIGLVDALVASPQHLLDAAKQWVQKNQHIEQPWDHPRYQFPEGGVQSPKGQQTLGVAIARARQKTHGNYPNVEYALACLHDGASLPLLRGLEVEARYFVKALYSAEAQNLIRTRFFGIQQAKKNAPKPTVPLQKIAVVGAGMMGRGIAYIAAQAGLEVLLQDRNLEKATEGRAYAQQRLQERVQKRQLTPQQAQSILNRITAVVDLNNQKGIEWVIEAVFEVVALKHGVLADTEKQVAKTSYLASNTSTLPITELGTALKHPQRFIGMHFFSPVEKMSLVEIIVGKLTDDATIEAAQYLARQLGKVPIVVQDSRRFFTSRVFATYTLEGGLLLQEGTPAALLEHAAQQTGMPVGPLAVLDEISLRLAYDILATTKNKHNLAERQFFDLLHDMVFLRKRPGRKKFAGFYDYPPKGQKSLWKGLAEAYPPSSDPLPVDWIQKRLLHVMALEAYRCLEEGVVASPTDGDVGSLLGWNFPAYTGGIFSYIDYIGIRQFVADCDLLERCCGTRFRVPNSLRERAVQNQRFHTR